MQTSKKLFRKNADIVRLFLFEQGEGGIAKENKVFRRLILADPPVIFIHCQIQNPVQFIFDNPMPATDLQNGLSTTE